MSANIDINAITRQGMSTESALAFFDELATVAIDDMLGTWHGEGFPTGHSMDGLLENFDWQGKQFISSEEVHPLMFNNRGSQVFLDPRWMPLKYARHTPLANNPVSRQLFRMLMPLMKTSQSRARLRMLEHRGKVSATMVYDEKPINDVFRKIDDDTLLGLMDLKGKFKPFFFLLRRA